MNRRMISRGGFGRRLALLVSVAGLSACSDDSTDPTETPEAADLALKSLSVSAGKLTPAFDPGTDSYGSAFADAAAVTVFAEPRNPDAKVRIAGVLAQEHRLRTPLGATEVEVEVSVGKAAKTYTLTLTRSGDYVAEAPIEPPDEPAMNEEDPNLKGYGYPTVSPDGRFIALQFQAPTVSAYKRWIDIYRADGPTIEFEKRVENTDIPVAFCDADPGCLWTYRSPFDANPGKWQFTTWDEGAWANTGPAWQWTGDTVYSLMQPDKPWAFMAYPPSGPAGVVALGSDGSIGAIDPVPGLAWSDQVSGFAVSADLTTLLHTHWNAEGDGAGLIVFEHGADGWVQKEIVTPPRPSSFYGGSMHLSPDGKELWIGDSWAEIDGKLEAGAVDHFTRGPNGYELVETFTEPTVREGGAFGGFLRGDFATGDVHVGAVDQVAFDHSFTLVYSLRNLDEAHHIEHPGGVLQAPRDASFFAGVSLDDRHHGVLNVYR